MTTPTMAGSMTELQQLQRQRQQQIQQRKLEEEFVRRLEKLYYATCRGLNPFREAMEFSQQVVLWKKPVASVFVFTAVHLAVW